MSFRRGTWRTGSLKSGLDEDMDLNASELKAITTQFRADERITGTGDANGERGAGRRVAVRSSGYPVRTAV